MYYLFGIQSCRVAVGERMGGAVKSVRVCGQPVQGIVNQLVFILFVEYKGKFFRLPDLILQDFCGLFGADRVGGCQEAGFDAGGQLG